MLFPQLVDAAGTSVRDQSEKVKSLPRGLRQAAFWAEGFSHGNT